MERQFNRNSYHSHWSNNVLPVVIYLTLPTENLNQNSRKNTGRKTKSQKQKQHDQERMKQFNEQKTVCSQFPFALVDNDEIQKMVTRSLSQTNSKSDKIKSYNIQEEFSEENNKLNSLIAGLKDNLRTMNEQLSHTQSENSELKHRLSDEQSKCMKLQTEHSNLQAELLDEQCLRKERETEFSDFKKQTYNAVDKEIENHRRIEKLHLQKVNELKTEIKRLKSELPNSGTTNNSTKVQTGAHQGVGSEMGKTSVENNQQRTTSIGAGQVPGCRKCGNTVSHPPRLCPAKNFMCEKCSKRGHHTFNCIHICGGCGGKRISCYDPANCVAKNMNCAYCSVKGHLAHVCLQKRYNELGY